MPPASGGRLRVTLLQSRERATFASSFHSPYFHQDGRLSLVVTLTFVEFRASRN